MHELDCRTVKSCNFKRRLGFNLHNLINTKEQNVLQTIKDAFKGEDFKFQHSESRYRIDLYFQKNKIAVEVDEYGHPNRDNNYETQTEEILKKKLGCVFIRINPDEQNFNIFNAINIIRRQVKKESKKLVEIKTAKSLIDKISKGLLELEFEKKITQ